MATCKICGNEDNGLPYWTNWDCDTCFNEQLNSNRDKNYEVLNLRLDVMREVNRKLISIILTREMAIALARAENEQ